MARYRKKPIVIEAVQWTGKNLQEIINFVGPNLDCDIDDPAWRAEPRVIITIKTPGGPFYASEGDYIIKGFRGEFYTLKEDTFNATYEKEEDDDD